MPDRFPGKQVYAHWSLTVTPFPVCRYTYVCVRRSVYGYVGRCLVDDAVLRLDAPLPASWLLLGKFPLVGKHLQQQPPAVEPAISHSTFCRTRTTSAGARCKITRLAGLIPFHTLYRWCLKELFFTLLQILSL